uniref:RNA helicase n=1 Tax=Lygus hesperus TaxID=30085 RepID=A0A0A9XY87_LYGHE
MARKKNKKMKGQMPKGKGKERSIQDFTLEELSGPRPPPWAKGRMIGLWHRERNMLKFVNGEPGQEKPPKLKQLKKFNKLNKAREPRCVSLDVPQEKISEIQDMLKQIGVPAPPCVQTTRAANVQDRYKHVEDSAFKTKFLRSLSGNIQDKITTTKTCSLRKDRVLDERYMAEERSKMSNGRYKEMLTFRKKLPAWDKRSELLDALDRHNVILVTGETGCGKTTQVAQFILEDAILAGNGSQTNIMCTQPRRISAITVAERVANERGERLGYSVGYQIRLEKVMPRSSASILYCTTGVLLQYMHGDPLLTKVSTVIVDEIHERNTVSDFVITLLKDIVPLRPDLKVILMSATMNADRFSTYFNNCPTVHIPGFTYPVDEYYLEDILEEVPFKFPQSSGAKMKKAMKELSTDDNLFMEAYYRDLEHSGKYSRKTIDSIKNPESNEISLQLIADLVKHICTRLGQGAILVFLPGWDKISALNKLLTQSGKFPPHRYRIIPLHSLMPTANQKKVFERPPRGMRKIVLATNIAETSITIDDVVYVIDCGKIKIKNFDVDGNVSTLKEEWVSLANARQRRGRAGRVQEGVCFHMYCRGREMLLQKDMLPEILRTRLEEVILQGKILQVGKIGPFLGKVMDPPSERAVELSLNLLTSMNALDSDENLTPLGFHLASLPIDPQAVKCFSTPPVQHPGSNHIHRSRSLLQRPVRHSHGSGTRSGQSETILRFRPQIRPSHFIQSYRSVRKS